MLHRGLHPLLEFATTPAFEEEIPITTELFNRCKFNRINPILNHCTAGGRNLSNLVRQRTDEIAELVGRQCPIDPAIAFSQLSAVVLCAQHDLERPGSAQETCEVLGTACSRNHAEEWLELTKNR